MHITESKIGGFWEEFHFFPSFPNFPSFEQLERLTLCGWPKLKSLPQELRRCTSLRFLYIASFNGMDSFPEWLGDLTSLRLLNIKSCKNLMHLPTAKAMQHLTKLRTLAIYDCPLLKERCTNERGLEWPKISHIPIILVIFFIFRPIVYDSFNFVLTFHLALLLGKRDQRIGVSFRISATIYILVSFFGDNAQAIW